MIYINFVELTSTIILAKLQNHRPERFKGFCYSYPWRPSWSCDLDHLMHANFRSSFLKMLHTKFNVDWPRRLHRKRCLKSVSENDDDGGRQSMASMTVLPSKHMTSE